MAQPSQLRLSEVISFPAVLLMRKINLLKIWCFPREDFRHASLAGGPFFKVIYIMTTMTEVGRVFAVGYKDVKQMTEVG
jgi:hypothetical protein